MKIRRELNRYAGKGLKLTPERIKVGRGRKQVAYRPKGITQKPATQVNRPKTS